MEYEWMIKPTPQMEWIEGEGKLIWLALFFIEIGAGLFFFSAVFSNLWGMFLGWFVVIALGGGSFLIHMGKPFRAYRALMRPQTSWIARGVIFIGLFSIVGAIHIVLFYLVPDLDLFPLKVITAIFCFLVAIYGGMLLSYMRAIPLWNSGLLPTIFIVAGFWGGAELLVGISFLIGSSVESVEFWIKALLPFFALLVPLYLITIRYSSATGSASISRILAGDLAIYFYVGVILIGLILPLIVLGITLSAGIEKIPKFIVLTAVLCGLIGDLNMRYCIMKGALYSPLISVSEVG
jgi:formate-dependent nitrite reductase membrane component NrfD